MIFQDFTNAVSDEESEACLGRVSRPARPNSFPRALSFCQLAHRSVTWQWRRIRFATNQGFRSIIVKSEYDHNFLYYWLKANTEELERHATGSTFKELSGSALKEIRVRLPENRNEQRAIAHILGTLDDKIELNRRMNATLEAMARALFRSWFVDFDPVRAKMEGRDTGLPKEIADPFPDRLADSELGGDSRGLGVGAVG